MGISGNTGVRERVICRRAALLVAGFVALPIAALGPIGAAGGPVTRTVSFAPDARIGDMSSFSTNAQYEPAIAANPRNPDNLVAVFFDGTKGSNTAGRFAFTVDGGATWTVGGALSVPPGFAGVGTDPSVAADLDGNFYYASIGGDSSIHLQGLVVAKSTDGGRTFPRVTVAASGIVPSFYIDKPYMAVDARPKSRFKGNIYVSFSNLDCGIDIWASRDGGTSWARIVTIPGTVQIGCLDGSLPVIGPDGSVYVFYMAFDEVFGDTSIRFSKSTDGGITWGPSLAAASGLPTPGEFDLQNGSPKSATTPGYGIIATSFPTAAAAPDGTLYVAWDDFPQGSCLTPDISDSPCFNADVRLTVSRNGGRTWTVPVKVTDEVNTTDQFFPWIATHPDGLLSIMWLDKRLDPDNERYDVFYTNTYDGVHFLPNVRVSTATSVPGNARFIGDYNGIAATATGVFPVWGDTRFSNDEIFTARGTLAP